MLTILFTLHEDKTLSMSMIHNKWKLDDLHPKGYHKSMKSQACWLSYPNFYLPPGQELYNHISPSLVNICTLCTAVRTNKKEFFIHRYGMIKCFAKQNSQVEDLGKPLWLNDRGAPYSRPTSDLLALGYIHDCNSI